MWTVAEVSQVIDKEFNKSSRLPEADLQGCWFKKSFDQQLAADRILQRRITKF
jgi:hypothetical protein